MMTRRSPHPSASPPLGIRLAPGSDVPVSDQIAVQMLGELRAGRHAVGDRLPSVRALSRDLGVHRSTVRRAYHRLAGEGLVAVRPGAGPYVSGPPADAFRRFLVREREAGRSFARTARTMERWRRAVSARRVTVVGTDAKLREVWAAELASDLAGLAVDVAHLSLEDARRGEGRLERSLVAAPPRAMTRIRERRPRWTPSLCLRPGPSSRLRRLLLRLPVGAVVAVATGSDVLARQLSQLAGSLRGGDVAVIAVDPRAGSEGDRALRVARFVLADMACRPAFGRRTDARRLRTLRHLPVRTGRRLARCFGPAPEAGGTEDQLETEEGTS